MGNGSITRAWPRHRLARGPSAIRAFVPFVFFVALTSLQADHPVPGNARKKITAYHRALSEDPRNLGVLNELGLEYKSHGMVDSAFRYLREAERLCPLPEVLNNLGNLHLDQGDTASARAYYQDAIQRSPENSYAFFNLGSHLWNQGNRELATELFFKALEGKQRLDVRPDVPSKVKLERWQTLWQAQPAIQLITPELDARFAIGQIDSATSPGEGPEERSGSFLVVPSTSLRNDTGNVLFLLGRYREAAYYYHLALQANPYFLNARRNLALCFYYTGAFDECARELEEIFFWEKVVKVRSVEDHAHEILISRYCPEIDPAFRPYATQIFSQGTLETGSDPQLYYIYAVHMEEAGDTAGCIAYYRKAVGADPTYHRARRSISRILYHGGNVMAGVDELSGAMRTVSKPRSPRLGFGGKYDPATGKLLAKHQERMKLLRMVEGGR